MCELLWGSEVDMGAQHSFTVSDAAQHELFIVRFLSY